MTKSKFSMQPKLDQPKTLPVQNFSAESIEKTALNSPVASLQPPGDGIGKKREVKAVSEKTVGKEAKNPQGRPPRTEPVKRISSDLPEDLYYLMQKELKEKGHTMNWFLAKLLREYFDK